MVALLLTSSLANTLVLAEPFQQDATTLVVSMEAENYDANTSQGGHAWVPGATSGASGDQSMVTSPNTGTARNVGYVEGSPRMDYRINFVQAGTYYVWLRGRAPTTRDDSAHVGLNGAMSETSDRISYFNTGWSWSSDTMDPERATIVIPTAGEHVLNLWMREDGFPLDKIVLAPASGYNPSSAGAFGPPQSPRGAPQPALSFDTGSLSFSADEGGAAPASQTLDLTASDGAGVSYSLAWTAGWLTVTPASGSTPAAGLSVAVDPAGLGAGTYTETVTASATGYLDSSFDVTFTVIGETSAFQQDATTLVVSMEAENYDANTSQGGHAWVPGATSGASGDQSMVTSPNTGTARNVGYVEGSPRMDYRINFVQAGTYYVWLRGRAPTTRDDSAHVGLNGAMSETSDRISYFNTGWSWSSDTMDPERATIVIPTAGEHVLNLWMREDGFPLDKIVLAPASGYNPSSAGAFGPPQSPRGAPQPALSFDTGSLSFSADEGGAAPASQTLDLTASDGAGVSYSLAWTAGWLTVTPASGSTPATGLSVAVDPAGLGAGTYTETVTASATGYLDSSFDVTFTVIGETSAFQQDATTLVVSMEAENYDANTSQGGHAWVPGATSGASGDQSMVTSPNTGTARNVGYVEGSPRMDYRINFVQAGTYYVWLRGRAPTTRDDSAHVGLNGAMSETSDRISYFNTGWSWSSDTMDPERATIVIPTAGEHVLNLWMREDGFPLDKIVLAPTAGYNPASEGVSGPPESPRGVSQPTLSFDSGLLSFSADEGGAAPATQTLALTASDGSAASYTLAWTASWLTVAPASGATPATGLSVTVDPTGLDAGTYTETVTASATGYVDDSFDVTFTVAGEDLAFQQDPTTLVVSMEAENYGTNTSQGGHDWVPGAAPNASGGLSMVVLPNSGVVRNTGYVANSPRLDYRINFAEAGTYYVWLRGYAPSIYDDSAHVGLNGGASASSDRISFFASGWSWSNATMDQPPATIVVPTAGEHTLNVWMREDGFPLDKIVLAPAAGYNPASEGVSGPPESPLEVSPLVLLFDTDRLIFSADEGGAAPAAQTLALTASDGSAASYTLAWTASWLTVAPASGATPATGLSVTVDPAGLDAGTYTETVTASATGYADDSFDVTFTVIGVNGIGYDFDDGDVSDWTPVETTSNAANWQSSGGTFNQLNNAGPTVRESSAYLSGTYAFLNTVANLTDFEVSAVITPTDTDIRSRGQDVGIHFRHVNDDNYYRLSVNSLFGFTRLERRIAGTMSTMALTSEGYAYAEQLRLGVRISGSVILVYRDTGGTGSVFDNAPYLAAYDQSLTSGTIALYTQGRVSFDDVLIGNLDGQMRVGVAAPAPFSVDADGVVDVQAVVLDHDGTESVAFELDGSLCDGGTVAMPAPGLYTAQCTAAGPGEHALEVRLSDAGGEIDSDDAAPIGTGGDEVITLGDSITNGTSDNFLADNVGNDILLGGVPQGPRQFAFRGYQARFHNEMTAAPGYGLPIIVFNEAIPGDRVERVASERIGIILERHPNATRAVVMIGTNDATFGISVPDYQDSLESIVTTLIGQEIEPMIAVPPPVWGPRKGEVYADPLSETPNQRIVAYAGAIATVNQNFGLTPGPDFFARFLGDGENLFSLFADNLHLNSAGQEILGFEWKEQFAPGGVSPVYFANLCIRSPGPDCQSPTLYKQTKVELANTYYIDESHQITAIPDALKDGIWLKTANSDKSNSREDYIEFTVDQNVIVYIAVQPTVTSLANWAAGFAPTGESIGSSASVGALPLYSRPHTAGSTIVLGGNVAAGAAGTASNNYIVILTPDPT